MDSYMDTWMDEFWKHSVCEYVCIEHIVTFSDIYLGEEVCHFSCQNH